MSLFDAWNQQYQDTVRQKLPAIAAWCAVNPSPNDWNDWLSSLPYVSVHVQALGTLQTSLWPSSLFTELAQKKTAWLNFLQGAMLNGFYQNTQAVLDAMRMAPTETGSSHSPLPLACLEALAEIAPSTSTLWKQSFLRRTPEYWFGRIEDIDSAGTQPLHELGVALLIGCQFSEKQLPSLAWSPRALYDDYGSIPESVQSYAAPIQHALEYAVYRHKVVHNKSDPLADAEIYNYFEHHNLSLSTFEALVDFSQTKPTLSGYIQILHSMVSPEKEQYHLDLTDEQP